MEVSKAMVDALITLEKKAYLFERSAIHFRKALESAKDFRPSKMSPLTWHVRYINGSMTTTLSPWIDFSEALKPAFASLAEVVKSQGYGPSLFQGALEISELAEKFKRKVIWFAVEMVRQHLSLLEQTPEVLPSKLEALKTPMRTFRSELNDFLEYAYADFMLVPGFFKKQVVEPFKYVGQGHCLDSQGQQYDTLTSQGCESVFWCMGACRQISACRGFTVHWPGDHQCARCELRVEEGFHESTTFWNYTWAKGNGHGPVASSTGNSHGYDTMPHCFGRHPYNTSEWTPRMRTALEEEQANQVGKYEAASELWVDIVARLKSAFWKIMSGIEKSTGDALLAELQAQQTSATM